MAPQLGYIVALQSWKGQNYAAKLFVISDNFAEITLEKSLNLALISLEVIKRPKVAQVALKMASVLESSQLDRWLSIAKKNEKVQFHQCRFASGNLTCPIDEGLNGWPIIVRKSTSWKNSPLVGLWQERDAIVIINNDGLKWAAKTVAASLQLRYMPSCRGPGMPQI